MAETDNAATIETAAPLRPAVPDDEGAFDDRDLSLLTDEERAALLGDDADDDANETDEDSGGEADADDADDAGAREATAADDAAGDDADATPAPKPEPVPDTAPLTAALAEIDKERDALVEQFEDGDLTREDYKAKLADLSKRERDVTGRIARAEAQQEAVRTAFYGEVRAYAREYPDLLAENGPHIEAFDRHVRAVTASADYEHLSYRQMLEAAHRLYVAESEVLGREHVPLKAAAPKPKADTPAPEAQKPKPKREIVPTLGKAPAAAPVAVSDSRFANLQQRLDAATTAAEIEAVMASMTPDEAEAFASMDV